MTFVRLDADTFLNLARVETVRFHTDRTAQVWVAGSADGEPYVFRGERADALRRHLEAVQQTLQPVA